MNRQYECVVVFSPDLDEAGVNEQVAKIEAIVANHSGKIVSRNDWGRKKLAYPIEKKEHGFYVLLIIEGDKSFVADLERQLRINDSVFRFLTVKKDKFAPDYSEYSDETDGRRSRSSDSDDEDSSDDDSDRKSGRDRASA